MGQYGFAGSLEDYANSVKRRQAIQEKIIPILDEERSKTFELPPIQPTSTMKSETDLRNAITKELMPHFKNIQELNFAVQKLTQMNDITNFYKYGSVLLKDKRYLTGEEFLRLWGQLKVQLQLHNDILPQRKELNAEEYIKLVRTHPANNITNPDLEYVLKHQHMDVNALPFANEHRNAETLKQLHNSVVNARLRKRDEIVNMHNRKNENYKMGKEDKPFKRTLLKPIQHYNEGSFYEPKKTKTELTQMQKIRKMQLSEKDVEEGIQASEYAIAIIKGHRSSYLADGITLTPEAKRKIKDFETLINNFKYSNMMAFGIKRRGRGLNNSRSEILYRR